jgi:hypothetical protein
VGSQRRQGAVARANLAGELGDYRGLSQVFEDAAAWWHRQLTLTETGHEPLRVNAIETTPNFFTCSARNRSSAPAS